jgi:AbrB family looped-hinge helix DNA binding protein
MSYHIFMKSITISSKGQIVIPAAIRKKMQLKTGDTLFVSETTEGNLLITQSVKKTKKVSEVAGLLKMKQLFTLEEIDELVSEGFEKSI